MAERINRRRPNGGLHRGGSDDKSIIRPEDNPHQRALDEWQRAMWKRVGLAIGRWLEGRGKLDQPISRLRIDELEGMAWAAVCEWLDVREERRRELNMPQVVDPAKPDPLDRMLTG